MNELKALLRDVGGTLWPEDWQDDASGYSFRVNAIRESMLLLPVSTVEQIVTKLLGVNGYSANLSQDVTAAILASCASLPVSLTANDAPKLRRAMAVRARPDILFPGASDLLAWVRDAGLIVILVSNTIWRDASVYREDLTALGFENLISGVITSVDVGFCKPHTSVFKAALAAANCTAAESIIVDDSEVNDILPARTLGIRTIQVAIEDEPPTTCQADALATSLAEAQRILDTWLREQTVAR